MYNGNIKKNWATKQWKTYWLFIFYKQLIRLDYDWSKVYFDFYGKFVTGQPVQWPKELYSIFPLSFCYNTFLTEQYVEHQNNTQLEVYVKNMVNDLKTGKKANFGSSKTIIEVFKKNTIENINFKVNDNLKYKFKKNNILKFY